MNRLVYLLALVVVSVIRLLPISLCFLLGRLAGLAVWAILPRYRALAKRNLRIAFGEGDGGTGSREVSRLARRHFSNLGANLVCSVKIPSMKPEKLRSRLRFENEQAWEDWVMGNKAGGRGTVAALSHFGNWEINAQIAEFALPRRSGCVYQAIRNPLIDDLINRDRRSRGVRTFDRRKEMQGAAAHLREGGVLGVLIDQHAGNAGIWMPMFGKLASTSPLAASLAERTDSLLVMVTIRTTGLARWVIHTSDPVPTAGRGIPEITMDLNHLLEREIRRSPADWFWVHNRWKTPHPNFLIADSKRGIHLPGETNASALHPFRLLVRSPNWLGDACMAAPAIRAIKSSRPDLRLTVAAPAKLAPLWREMPEVDEVVDIPPKASPRKVARLLKPGRYDAAILLPNSVRSALEIWLARIPRRVGRSSHRGRRFLNQLMDAGIQLHPVRHQSAELLAMVAKLGAQEAPSRPPRPTPPGPLRVALCPGAEYGPAKRWSLERYRAVIDKVSEGREISWVVVGTAKEAPFGERLAGDSGGIVENLCGKTTLPELISELKRCHLLLTNDTGTMHLADLLGVPVVAIFGSTESALTGPSGVTHPPHRVIRRKVECSPCYLRSCPIDFRCMNEVTVEMVAAAVLESLNAISQGA